MRDYYGTCLYCGQNYTKSRIDQDFCKAKCRYKYYYVPVPQCKKCSDKKCKYRDEHKKYAPKECPDRL